MDSDSGVSSGPTNSHASTSGSPPSRRTDSWPETVVIHRAEGPAGASSNVAGDDEPPPIPSDSEWSTDSDEEEAEENATSDIDGSLPSLRILSDSSDSGFDDEDAPSDDSRWDDSEAEDELYSALHVAAARRLVRTDAGQDMASSEHPHPHSNPSRSANLDFVFREYYAQMPRPVELLDLLIGPRSQPADNDPERAQTLMAGLEVVPDELIGRYEKVRGGVADDSDGCVICREELATSPGDPSIQDETTATCALFAALPFHPSYVILAFPCPGKHLFHRHCIAPWLARKTTCPSCRFDIDPDSLTLRRSTSPRAGGSSAGAPPERIWEAPRVRGFLDWLEREERIRDGIADRSDEVDESIPFIERRHDRVSLGNLLARVARGPDSEEDDDNWVDTDSDGDSPTLASHPSSIEGNQDDLARLLRDASLSAAALSDATRRQTRISRSRIYAARTGSRSPPSANVHDAVLEDIFLRALHMGRSLDIASHLLTSSSAPRSDRATEEDEIPNPRTR